MGHDRLIHRLSRLSLSAPSPSLSHSRRALRTTSKKHASDDSSTREPITAAPPIDLPPISVPTSDKALERLRIVPASPSYFSAAPRFMDDYLHAASLLAKYAPLPQTHPSLLPRAVYQTHLTYRSALAEPIKRSAFARMLGILRRLSYIHPTLMPADVTAILDRFRRIVDPSVNRPRPIFVDEHGRARAIGRRKESAAAVWLVEGDGDVRVNGKSLARAFGRAHDRESAVWPLTATQRMDKYNVWAVVRGGGTTGQAEALTLAVARALLVHEPGLKPALRRAGVVTRDPRMVERKKPGKLKARKMPAWVKR